MKPKTATNTNFHEIKKSKCIIKFDVTELT